MSRSRAKGTTLDFEAVVDFASQGNIPDSEQATAVAREKADLANLGAIDRIRDFATKAVGDALRRLRSNSKSSAASPENTAREFGAAHASADARAHDEQEIGLDR